MKLDSKYFDRIRVKPDRDRTAETNAPRCEWSGCEKPATHPAPKGRGQDGEYFHFCFDHVREYNASYNYFKGMRDQEFIDYQRQAMYGHRPTWRLGQNSWAYHTRQSHASRDDGFRYNRDFYDPYEVFGGSEGSAGTAPRRQIRNAERKALDVMGLDENATPEALKAQFKRLVKRHHPDTNGGNRDGEDKLRAVINAYNYLKSVGFC
ncbi:J domain-containing protein [Rhodoligotrophos defluvii]|uniref:J domain-containing protein n=1 Tax=Rhodoligotrophos defluvii TaxID=2561934 RepID=UPI0010C9E34A|nr:J domain-containing protein [Rhodoligotrophos defluvii]